MGRHCILNPPPIPPPPPYCHSSVENSSKHMALDLTLPAVSSNKKSETTENHLTQQMVTVGEMRSPHYNWRLQGCYWTHRLCLQRRLGPRSSDTHLTSPRSFHPPLGSHQVLLLLFSQGLDLGLKNCNFQHQ